MIFEIIFLYDFAITNFSKRPFPEIHADILFTGGNESILINAHMILF